MSRLEMAVVRVGLGAEGLEEVPKRRFILAVGGREGAWIFLGFGLVGWVCRVVVVCVWIDGMLECVDVVGLVFVVAGKIGGCDQAADDRPT